MSTITMCADQHCPEYGTCYRAQAEPEPDQRFWAVSPREGNSCRFYAPIYFTNGLSALREDAQWPAMKSWRLPKKSGSPACR